MQKIVSASPEQTREAGLSFAKTLRPGAVVAFRGGLGAGKTAFISGMAQAFGVTDEVSSPTYALVHSYRGSLVLHHFDMYRIVSWEDLYSTGFFDYLEQSAVIAVEWSEHIENALPSKHYVVKLMPCDGQPDMREIYIYGEEEH